MMQTPTARLSGMCTVTLCILTGCSGISIAPSCPAELEVGQSGTVWANEEDPGAVPTYLWETLPSDAGTFADPAAPVTSFQALKEGEVTIRLTATDGLFQAVSQCQTSVIAGAIAAVSLEVDPDPVVVEGAGILSCSSVGDAEAVTFTLEQLDGTPVTLTQLAEGVALFTPAEVGELTFRCVGTTEDGRVSEPSDLTVTVAAPPDGSDGDNGDDGGRPPRTGR